MKKCEYKKQLSLKWRKMSNINVYFVNKNMRALPYMQTMHLFGQCASPYMQLHSFIHLPNNNNWLRVLLHVVKAL